MKRLMAIQEVEGEGIETLLGKDVLVFGMNYIYAGKLTGVNPTCIELEDPKIVYSTGDFKTKTYVDAQALPGKTLYVQTSAIESIGLGK